MTTGRRQIRLVEHQTALHSIDDRDVYELVRNTSHALDLSPTAEKGVFQLRARSLVGTVTTANLEILIQPKIPLENVFLLLEPADVPLELRSDRVGFGTHDDLAAALAAFYARLLERTLRRGLRKDYQRQDDQLVALRGRLAMNRQIRTPLATPLQCTYDEYTEDVPLNRLLKAAAIRLLRLGPIGEHNRDALRHALMWFGEVGDRPPPVRPLLDRGFNRLNAHYEPAARLAALVLEASSIREDFGSTSANSFLIDMNRVFEAFLESRLRAALRGTLQVKGQDRLHLDTRHQVPMQPDLVFYHGRNPVYVGDAKYKITDDLTGRHSDLYQLLAYTTALGLTEGVLIYTLTEGTNEELGEIEVARASKRLVVRPIDLRGDRDRITQSVSDLADWIHRRTAPVTAQSPTSPLTSSATP